MIDYSFATIPKPLLKATSTLLLLLLAVAGAQAQATKLDRGWQLLTDPTGGLKVNDVAKARGWRDVRVGLSWNAQFTGFASNPYAGTASMGSQLSYRWDFVWNSSTSKWVHSLLQSTAPSNAGVTMW